MVRSLLGAVLRHGVIAFCAFIFACGESSPEDWEPGRPRINQLAFVQQSPGQPLSLEFSIVFADSDGDLGSGKVLLAIEGRELASLELALIFSAQRPPIEGTATTGTIHLLVDLQTPVDVGDKITLGFKLEDEAGGQSNEPTITLQAIGDGA